jgi:carbon storage regulator CsrA
MLVLSRKVDEAIQIGDSITVLVTRINANRVLIGISAPPDVEILRRELCPERTVAEIELGMRGAMSPPACDSIVPAFESSTG